MTMRISNDKLLYNFNFIFNKVGYKCIKSIAIKYINVIRLDMGQTEYVV